MAGAIRKQVTIVNGNYPPGPGVTGESANELAGFLQANGIRVKVVHTDVEYAGGGAIEKPVGEVHTVRSLYGGKNKLLRLMSAFISSRQLVRKARSLGTGPIIVMSDPAFLVFWASRLLKNRAWAYWSMDLYPQAFKSAGLIAEGNPFYKWYERTLKDAPPAFLITMGAMQRRFLEEFYNGRTFPGVDMPCGIMAPSGSVPSDAPEWWTPHDDKVYLGYCGNLGEAHSDLFVQAVMERLDPHKHVFILSVYGSRADAVLESARGIEAVRIVRSVPRRHLTFIDVHLVSLRSEWSHVCSPSKGFSAVCSGSALLFCGATDTDLDHYLRPATILVDEGTDPGAQLDVIMPRLDRKRVDELKRKAGECTPDLVALKSSAFQGIAEWLHKQQ